MYGADAEALPSYDDANKNLKCALFLALVFIFLSRLCIYLCICVSESPPLVFDSVV